MFLLPITKHLPIKLQLLFIRAVPLDNALIAKCFIHVVTCCVSFIRQTFVIKNWMIFSLRFCIKSLVQVGLSLVIC